VTERSVQPAQRQLQAILIETWLMARLGQMGAMYRLSIRSRERPLPSSALRQVEGDQDNGRIPSLIASMAR
jgi:hypothetical protein